MSETVKLAPPYQASSTWKKAAWSFVKTSGGVLLAGAAGALAAYLPNEQAATALLVALGAKTVLIPIIAPVVTAIATAYSNWKKNKDR